MGSLSGLELVVLIIAGAALAPVGVLVHELGHAFAARRFGADVNEVVAAPEGGSLSFVLMGFRVRFGLGLGRDLRSTDPEGWALVAVEGLTAAQLIAVLRAGPRAEAIYGACVAIAALVADLPGLPTVLLVLGGLQTSVLALVNLGAGGPPTSDGARIAALRDLAILEKWDVVPPGSAARYVHD